MRRGKDDDPPGYSELMLCDANSGYARRGDGVLVPLMVAAELNSLRIALDEESAATDFFRAAAPLPRRLLDSMTRRRVLYAIGTAAACLDEMARAELDSETQARAAHELLRRAKKDDVAEPPPSEIAQPVSPPPGPSIHQPGEVTPDGCFVEVFKPDAFAKHKEKLARIEDRSMGKNSQEALALLDMKVSIELGPARLAKLIIGWKAALEKLTAEMPNFAHVIERLAQQCALAAETATPLCVQPLLLVGGPGVGKSHFARRLAATLQLPEFVYNLESAESTSIMLGSERHWTGAEPGVLYRLLLDGFGKPDAAVANPLIVLDEIDKAPASRSGHYKPRDSLIPLLERSTAGALRDKCSEVTFNARHVIYVATANALSTIDAPMQSRFDIQLAERVNDFATPGDVNLVCGRRVH